jgi:hypothetical protein
MSDHCPECGAHYTNESTCQAVFDTFLVLEFTEAAFGSVHFLTVACFMIQHGRYSDEGLKWIERQLRAHLEEQVPVEEIRRRAQREADQASRRWKVNRQPDEPPPPQVAWSMTIADVAAGYLDEHGQPDAGRYCQLIRQWARTTLNEMRNDQDQQPGRSS